MRYATTAARKVASSSALIGPFEFERAVSNNFTERRQKMALKSAQETSSRHNLTVQMSNCRNALKTVSDRQVYGRIAQSIHRLNRQLHELLCVVKEDKISRLSAN